jgi:hypothetical protein
MKLASIPERESTAGWTVYHCSNSLRRGQVPPGNSGGDHMAYGKAAYVYRTRVEAERDGREIHGLILSYHAQIAPYPVWLEMLKEALKRGHDDLDERHACAQTMLREMGYDGVCSLTGADGSLTIAVWTDGLLKRDASQARAA